MTNAVPLPKRIELLLNTLRGERHLRRPLLVETVGLLATLDGPTAALRASHALLERLDAGIDDSEFERRIARIVSFACNGASAISTNEASEC
jgi:hypothetical protein